MCFSVLSSLRLKPFTSYQFRIKATNDIGDSEYSQESEAITTLQDGKSNTMSKNLYSHRLQHKTWWHDASFTLIRKKWVYFWLLLTKVRLKESKFKSKRACLETGFLWPANLCNHLALKHGPEVEGVTCLTSGQPIGYHNCLATKWFGTTWLPTASYSKINFFEHLFLLLCDSSLSTNLV